VGAVGANYFGSDSEGWAFWPLECAKRQFMELTSDPADAKYFDSDQEMVDYLSFWMEEGSPREIARALGDVARAKGITEVSLDGPTGAQELSPALSRDGNPKLDLVTAVLKALGLELTVRNRAA
jgi:probable addiction module antidote protein